MSDEVVDGEVVENEQDEEPAAEAPQLPSSGTVAVYDGAPAAPVAQRAGMLDRATDSWVAVASDVIKLASYIAPTEFVPQAMQGRPAVVAAAILHGRELGLAPMTALGGTHVIHGRVGISSETMRGLVLAARHAIRYEETSSARCVVRGRRADEEDWTRVEWTIADAQRAGLTTAQQSKDRWAKYPRQMLAARATAELCRLVFADVIHGMSAVEELDDAIDAELPAVAAAPAAAAPTTVRRRQAALPASEAEPEKAEEEPAPAQPAARKKPALPPRGRAPQTAGEGGSTPPPSPVPDHTQTPGGDADGKAVTAGATSPAEGDAGQVGEPAPAHGANADDVRPGGDGGTSPAAVPTPDDPIEVDRNPEPLRMIKPGQRAQIMGHAERLGFKDRDARLIILATLAGLDKLDSANHLTELQAADILIRLERCRDRAALDKLLEQS